MSSSHVEVVPQERLEVFSQPYGRIPEPTVVVIFGASGDLTKRKLLPALFHLEQSSLLPEEFAVAGVARRDLAATFAADMKAGIVEGGVRSDDLRLRDFMEKVSYHSLHFDDSEGYVRLKEKLAEIDRTRSTKGNRLFYLAVAPEYFQEVINNLGKHSMNNGENGGHARIIIEKPFGHDLASAVRLNDAVANVFDEDQIFRIDHYVGKETVQNIFVFRFAQALFEPLWNSQYIDNVQMTAAESIGIDGRGPFYEKAGASRDILQNHMMEMLAYIAMDRPRTASAEDVIAEKVKVLKAIQPLTAANAVRGQYGKGMVDGREVRAYREEERVNPESLTETFAAVKMEIDTPRWTGVPFYLRAGKRLAKRVTEVVIQFKPPAHQLFSGALAGPCQGIPANLIRLRIQPDEGIKIVFGNKLPVPTTAICPVEAVFRYADAFGKYTANGYERLLLDGMMGDPTLFTHRDAVEAAWSLYTPLLHQWAAETTRDFPNYPSGTWGPAGSDELLARDGRQWHSV